MRDPRAWAVWVVTTLVLVSSTRNPLYVVLVLLSTMVVGGSCALDAAQGRQAILAPLRFAAVAVPFAAIFNAATAHIGEATFFRLPSRWPLIGGPWTGEAMLFGAVNGLVLTTIYSAFSAFNRAISVRDLIRLTPRALHEAGVVICVALTFVPQTTRNLRRIREAQAVRGHRVRGWRDWLPIVVPLLIGGMEQALALAEAMVARGYGAVSERRQAIRTQVVLVVGLVALLIGWITYSLQVTSLTGRWLAAVCLALGGGVIVGVVVALGQGTPSTVYRPHPWAGTDTLGVAGCVAVWMVILLGRGALYYTPYPRWSWPSFHPLVGVGLLGLLMPAILTAGGAGESG